MSTIAHGYMCTCMFMHVWLLQVGRIGSFVWLHGDVSSCVVAILAVTCATMSGG